MPELPEVETVKRSLEPIITGLIIEKAVVNMSKIIKEPSAEGFISLIAGKKITGMDRRGKYIIINLKGGYSLVIHLRMTGQLVYKDANQEIVKHTHVILSLSNGQELRYIDQRQFGRLYLLPSSSLQNISGIEFMGVEPLGEDFTKEYFKKELRNKRTKIKPLLLDQTFIAGIGNIYADEALHQARIHPERSASSLNARDVTRLYNAIQDVLKQGIANRGTSFKDYVDGEGKKGDNQNMLKVYGREKEPCPNCKTLIERKKIGGRSSHYCPRCQKY